MKSQAAQRISRDEEERGTAQAWADSMRAAQDLEQVATEARRRYEEAASAASARQRELCAYVGRNIPTKLYKTDKGFVIVQHVADERATVALLDPV